MDLVKRRGGLRSVVGVCCLLGLFGHSAISFVLRSSNDKPIIGILAQETDFKSFQKFGSSYIGASYVKFIESAGARVVPVRLNRTAEEYDKIFSSVNGFVVFMGDVWNGSPVDNEGRLILYPGGGVSIETSEFSRVARIFYNKALEAYDKGDYFPVWGTCLGHQLLSYLTSGENLLVRTNTDGFSLPVNFTKDFYKSIYLLPALLWRDFESTQRTGGHPADDHVDSLHFSHDKDTKNSRMFQNFPDELLYVLTSEPVTSNFHFWSLSVQNFTNNEKLYNFYKILTTNVHNNIEFVSTMEAFRYPVYGVQWHPEKNPYEWKKPNGIPHSRSAMKVTYYTADFFVSEARKSLHRFASKKDETEALIYNFNPIFTGTFSSFEQAYFFD